MEAITIPFVQWSWVAGNLDTIRGALVQHVELSAIAIAIGFAISLPLAVVVFRYRRFRAPVLLSAGLLYTVPSVAVFALIQPITGFFSVTTAEVALVGYTLLILVRNTVAGLEAVPDEVRESARAVGYSTRAQMLRIYVPLALPSVFAGLRTATVTVVGLVTVTAFIGLGGLGQLVIMGFDETFTTPIVVGLVLSIALAGLADASFVALEHVLLRWNRARAT